MRILLTHDDVPQLEAGQTVHAYGLALFRFLVAHDAIGLLTIEQLELAKHASVAAVIAPGLLDETREQLQNLRYRLAATINAHAAIAKVEAEPLGAPARSGPQPSSPVPLHPVPHPLAPVGAAASRHDLDVGF